MFSYYFCVLLFELYFSKDINENLILLPFLMKVVNTIKGTFFLVGVYLSLVGAICPHFVQDFSRAVLEIGVF